MTIEEQKKNLQFFQVTVNASVPLEDSDGTDCVDPARYETVNAVLALPDDYDPAGEPCPIIMFCHGYGGFVRPDRWRAFEGEHAAFPSYYMKRGFALFDVDNTAGVTGGYPDLGCPKLMESYRKAFAYIRAHYNVQPQVLIYSVSFGTFTAMNMMCRAPYMVKAACMTGCRFGVKVVFDRPGKPYSAMIARNFGFRDRSGESYEADRLVGMDPYSEICVIDGKERLQRQLPPIKAMISRGDTREFEVAQRTLLALKNAGNDIHLRILKELDHGQICDLTEGDLKEELRLWYERFI